MEEEANRSTRAENGSAPGEVHHHVFVSYSRRQTAFVDRLGTELQAADKEPWIDRHSIPPAGVFRRDLEEGVAKAQAVIFVISKDSIESPFCLEELDHAAGLSKRIIPLLVAQVDPALVPEAVRERSWIPQTGVFEDDWGASFRLLLRAIDTDLDWLREHTRWGDRARDWEASGRDPSLLLRGEQLRAAEAWLTGRTGQEPAPSRPHVDLVVGSRAAAEEDARSERRRQRRVRTALAIGLVMALGAAIVALIQRNNAIEQEQLAESQALTARAQELLGSDQPQAVRVAKEALQTAHTENGEAVLRVALIDGPREKLQIPSNLGAGAVLSPDGKRIASVAANAVNVIDSDTAQVLRRVRHRSVFSAVFSHDGKLLATSGGQTRLWEVDSGDLVQVLPGQSRAASFSPDDRKLATAGAHVRVWQVRDGARVRTLHDGESLDSSLGFWSAGFDPSGKRVVAAGDGGTAVVWDTTSGRVLERLRHGARSVSGAVFSPDGRSVISVSNQYAGGDSPEEAGSAQIWDLTSETVTRELDPPGGGQVNSADFSPDGRRVITTDNRGGGPYGQASQGAARIWDVRSGRLLDTLHHGETRVVNGRFSLDGHWIDTFTSDATIGADEALLVWDSRDTRNGLRTLKRFSGDALSASCAGACLALSTNGRLAVAVDGAVQVIDSRSGEPLQRVQVGSQISGVALSHDGKVLATSGGETRLWSVGSGDLLQVLPGRLEVAAFSPDDQEVITTGARARIWDVGEGKMVQDLRDHEPTEYIVGASFAPDGERVVTAGSETQVWNLANEEVESLSDPDGLYAKSAVFGREGGDVLTIVGDEGYLARLWDIGGGSVRQTFQHGGIGALTADLSPDGERVVTVGHDGLVVWDADSGRDLQTVLLDQARTADIDAAFTPDGAAIAIDAALYKRDGETGGLLPRSRRIYLLQCGVACMPLPALMDAASRAGESVGAEERDAILSG